MSGTESSSDPAVDVLDSVVNEFLSENDEPSGAETWNPKEFELTMDGKINKFKAPVRQHHYTLEVNEAAGSADLQSQEVLQSESVITSMPLCNSVSGRIVQLFKSIDADNSGEITVDDFDLLVEDDSDMVAETWAKLADSFDADNDGSITLEEFRLGFKGYGIESQIDAVIGFEAPFDWTIADWSTEIARVMNKSVLMECRILGGWFAQFDGKKGELKTVASAVERAEDAVLMAMYLTNEAETQIHKLFDVLDKDGNGVLEAMDFAVMSKNPGTTGLWEEVKAHFDEDGDESITIDEFKRHIVNTVCEKIPLGSIPRKDWTWRQVIARLSTWANSMVMEQCRELCDYTLYGEYGTADADKEDAGYTELMSQFGCGHRLGEPAFPGGEPYNVEEDLTTGLSASFGALQASEGPAAFTLGGPMALAPGQAPPPPPPAFVAPPPAAGPPVGAPPQQIMFPYGPPQMQQPPANNMQIQIGQDPRTCITITFPSHG
eukprot:m.112718 g.112718  ORF g.112718 m.112718 type:complete len:491 (+) comp17036_c0_seq1:111-1583(+)